MMGRFLLGVTAVWSGVWMVWPVFATEPAQNVVERVRQETPEEKYRAKGSQGTKKGNSAVKPPRRLRHHRDETRLKVIKRIEEASADKGKQ